MCDAHQRDPPPGVGNPASLRARLIVRCDMPARFMATTCMSTAGSHLDGRPERRGAAEVAVIDGFAADR
jgi:hypothetical protein